MLGVRRASVSGAATLQRSLIDYHLDQITIAVRLLVVDAIKAQQEFKPCWTDWQMSAVRIVQGKQTMSTVDSSKSQ